MTQIAEAWLDERKSSRAECQGIAAERRQRLARRLIRQALRRAGCDLTDVSFDHIEASPEPA